MEGAIGSEWTRLGLRQLSGMLILVYVRSEYLVRSPLTALFASSWPHLKSSLGCGCPFEQSDHCKYSKFTSKGLAQSCGLTPFVG